MLPSRVMPWREGPVVLCSWERGGGEGGAGPGEWLLALPEAGVLRDTGL